MQPFKYYIKNPKILLTGLLIRIGYKFIPEKFYLELLYRLEIGKWPNIDNPTKFTEKIQWLKLYDHNSEYTKMVDKYAVKQYVAEKIGKEYIIPTLGIWEKAEDIDWDNLPEKFVLKTTHGGGGHGIIICRSKEEFDKKTAIKQLNIAMKKDIAKNYKEWPYKNVHKRIIAEEYMEDANLHELRDYKFFCFGGRCRCFKVDYDRFTEHHANYYDTKGNLLMFGEVGLLPNFNKSIEIPENINLMIELANKLSATISFLRVDFYNVNGKIYFGETTFYPGSGLVPFEPEEWDEILGSWIELPNDGRRSIIHE